MSGTIIATLRRRRRRALLNYCCAHSGAMRRTDLQ